VTLDVCHLVGCTRVMSDFDARVECHHVVPSVVYKHLKQKARQRCVGINGGGPDA
jgi:hypothetical protein